MAQTSDLQKTKSEISTFSGVKGGAVFIDMDPITKGPYGLADPVVDFPVGVGSQFGIEAGACIPLATSFSLHTSIAFAYDQVSMFTTVPGTVKPRAVPIPVTFGETLEMNWWLLTMGARIEWSLGAFSLQGGLGAFFPGAISALAAEEILDTPGATYDEVNTRRTRFKGGIVGKTSLTTSLRAAYVVHITPSLDIVPFIEGELVPFSIASELGIRKSGVAAGVQVRLASSFFTGPDLTPVMITAPKPPPDEVVWGKRTFETPLPEITMIRKPFLASAVQVELTGPDAYRAKGNDIVVNVLNCLRLRLADKSIDAESTIWDATRFELIHKDSILDASPPTAVIRVRSTAEAGIKSGVVRAMSGGALAFEDSWAASSDTVFTWPLRELPVTALAGDTSTIVIQSTVEDQFGGESASIPQHIVVIRSRPTKRSALVPDLVTAEFTPPTFIKGSSDLSKAGRGLVAALSDHIQEAKSVKLTGPLERCKRVLSELAPTGHIKIDLPEADTDTTETVIVTITR